jgi:hypothetical protein
MAKCKLHFDFSKKHFKVICHKTPFSSLRDTFALYQWFLLFRDRECYGIAIGMDPKVDPINGRNKVGVVVVIELISYRVRNGRKWPKTEITKGDACGFCGLPKLTSIYN